jgi:hypothetical protein
LTWPVELKRLNAEINLRDKRGASRKKLFGRSKMNGKPKWEVDERECWLMAPFCGDGREIKFFQDDVRERKEEEGRNIKDLHRCR